MKRNIAIAAATAAVLLGGGLAATAAFADSDGRAKDDRTAAADRAAEGTDGSRGTGSTGTAARVGVEQAVGAALKAVPGTVTEAERDDDDHGSGGVWELDVHGSDQVRHEVKVDATDGRVLSHRVDDDNDDRDRPAPRSAAVSLDAAVRAALGARAGTVTSVDLDDDGDGRGGRTHWEVDVTGEDGKRYELRVDAGSGKVTEDRHHDDGHGHGHGHDDGDDD
ncbi:PepSY domain-containing protein [Streptomyces sp. NPDC058008]|uniref:PepSY domain-containing protein n=1 Tax=Streptomyces sp. NPDC058008 TaxID=3346303 RepID=UPI0036F16672